MYCLNVRMLPVGGTTDGQIKNLVFDWLNHPENEKGPKEKNKNKMWHLVFETLKSLTRLLFELTRLLFELIWLIVDDKYLSTSDAPCYNNNIWKGKNVNTSLLPTPKACND